MIVPVDGEPPATPFTNNTDCGASLEALFPNLAMLNGKVCPASSTTAGGLILMEELEIPLPQPINVAKPEDSNPVAIQHRPRSNIFPNPEEEESNKIVTH